MQEIGGWIKNADTKVTILAGSLGVVLSVGASRLGDLIALFTDLPLLTTAVAIALLCVFVVTTANAGRWVFVALIPRTDTGERANRFAWPYLASLPVAPREFDASIVAAECWDQAYSLARIAARKYSAFRRALEWFFVAMSSLLVLVVALAVFH